MESKTVKVCLLSKTSLNIAEIFVDPIKEEINEIHPLTLLTKSNTKDQGNPTHRLIRMVYNTNKFR